MPPTTPDDDLPPADDFPAPKEDTEEGTTSVLEEEMPVEEGEEKPADEAYEDSDADAPPAKPKSDDDAPPAEENDDAPPEPGDTNTTSHDQPLWRLWTDNTGKHQTKAILVGVNLTAGKISLRKENGKRIGVPLNKLSPVDQQLIRDMAPAVANVTR